MQEHVRPPIGRQRGGRKREGGWWERNWKWAAPALGVGGLSLMIGFAALIFAFVFGLMKSSDAYKDAVARAKADPSVQAALGAPIEEGMFVTGSINTSGQSGNADLAIPISGPNGAATIHLDATMTAGMWTFNMLFVDVHNGSERIDLLARSGTAETATF